MKRLIFALMTIWLISCRPVQEENSPKGIQTRCIYGHLYGATLDSARLAIFPLFDDDGRPTKCLDMAE